MLTSEDIVNSIRQSDNDVKEVAADDGGDPLCPVSSRQAHSAFLDIKAFLLRACTDEVADCYYNLLSNLEMEITRFSYSTTSIANYFEKV